MAELFQSERNVGKPSHHVIRELIRTLRARFMQSEEPEENVPKKHIWKKLNFLKSEEFRSIKTPLRNRLRPKSSLRKPFDLKVSNTSMRSTGNGEFYCSKCKKGFKRSLNLQKHVRMYHPPTKCKNCTLKFSTVDELKNHIVNNHSKDVNCPLCRRRISDWNNANHLSIHFYEHKCPTCANSYYDPTVFQRHKQKCPIEKYLQCHYCHNTFDNIAQFRRHCKEIHNDTEPFKCNHCNVNFKYLMPLSRHLEVHNKSVVDTPNVWSSSDGGEMSN